MAAMEVNYARKHGLKMTIRRAKKLLVKQAIVSVVKEMIQLHSMKTWTGVHVRDITTKEAQRIISSSMFLKDKYTAEGFFDKLKARLVAGGHLQDKQIYETVTSPTTLTIASTLPSTDVSTATLRPHTLHLALCYPLPGLTTSAHTPISPSTSYPLEAFPAGQTPSSSSDTSMASRSAQAGSPLEPRFPFPP